MDWIGFVEAVYRGLDSPSHEHWLEGVEDALGDVWGGPIGSAIYFRDATRFQMFPVGARKALPEHRYILQAMADDPELVVRLHSGKPFETLTSIVGKEFWNRPERTFPRLHKFGIRDGIGFNAHDGGPWGITLSTFISKERTVTAREAKPWSRFAAHVHAAMRARFALHGPPDLPISGESFDFKVDAVLSPRGRVEHAETSAHPHLGDLQRAAIAIDRARARMRREDPEGALEVWSSLVAGEWSLVDRFESDGRRFVVARRNPPGAPATPLLTDRERRVLALRTRSHGVKLIAYEMGISPASVSRALASSMKKLGVASVAHLTVASRRKK